MQWDCSRGCTFAFLSITGDSCFQILRLQSASTIEKLLFPRVKNFKWPRPTNPFQFSPCQCYFSPPACYLYPCLALLVPGAWRLLCFHTYPRFLNIPQSCSLAFLLKFQVDITHSLNTGPTKQRELEKNKDTTTKQSSSGGSMVQSQVVEEEAVW